MLTLIPLEGPLLAALRADPTATARRLSADGAAVSGPLAEVAAATAAPMERTRAAAPWLGHLARDDAGALVGTWAFKAPPTEGAVEIAYFTFAGHEGRGVGRDMAARRVAIAAADPSVPDVRARTAPEEGASIRILRRLGFAAAGLVHDPEDGAVRERVRRREGA